MKKKSSTNGKPEQAVVSQNEVVRRLKRYHDFHWGLDTLLSRIEKQATEESTGDDEQAQLAADALQWREKLLALIEAGNIQAATVYAIKLGAIAERLGFKWVLEAEKKPYRRRDEEANKVILKHIEGIIAELDGSKSDYRLNRKIAVELNRKNVTTVRGKRWDANNLKAFRSRNKPEQK